MFLHDERGQRIFEVPPAGARLGRDPECELNFPDQETLVSAFHARVFCKDDGSWWLEDVGSTNGTWVKGARIAEPVRLRTGDRFTLGQRGPGIGVNVPGELKRTLEEKPIDTSRPLLRLRRVKGGEAGRRRRGYRCAGPADCAGPCASTYFFFFVAFFFVAFFFLAAI